MTNDANPVEPLIATLYCIELRTTRWGQMVEWYRKVLGSRCLVRVVEDGYALLEVGAARLAIMTRRESSDASGRWSLAFEVNRLPEYLERLREMGTPAAGAGRNEEGLYQIRCRDPDGNLIRLFSWPEKTA